MPKNTYGFFTWFTMYFICYFRRFYICCDTCQDWFHGRCVGVLQAESSNIDEYVCPNCDPDTPLNHANLKTLEAKDYPLLGKLLKLIQSHKSAWPFLEPVDPAEAPNYYRVVKEPMGKCFYICLLKLK